MQIKKIANTTVLFHHNPSKIINIQILTDIGSSDESANIYGAAHFLEHMFFKGTPKRDAKRVNRDADLMGAKLNAWTWHDQTCYHISVMQEKFAQGFELLSDIYLNATFPEDELEKERTVILSEMRRYDDDPSSYLSDHAVDQFCLNGLAHKVIGTEETVNSLTREQLLDFKSLYYGGDNIVISIAGNLTLSEVTEVIETHFHNKECQSPQKLVLGNYKSGQIDLNKPEIQESQYQLLYPALPYLHPDATKQTVMVSVLGGNASALLFERIREELGLCYGIYSRTYRFEGFNYIDISTGCAAKDLDTVHSEVQSIIKKLVTTPIDSERLEMVKASMLSSLYMSIESSGGLNSMLALAYIKGDRKGDILERRAQEIKDTTIEDIQYMAKETFDTPGFKATLTPN